MEYDNGHTANVSLPQASFLYEVHERQNWILDKYVHWHKTVM